METLILAQAASGPFSMQVLHLWFQVNLPIVNIRIRDH